VVDLTSTIKSVIFVRQKDNPVRSADVCQIGV